MPNVPKPVILDKHAQKWLLSCRNDDLVDRLREKIAALNTMPDVPGVSKIQGTRDMYRVRVGDYRIVYQYAPDFPLILVSNIAHRKEVYRAL